MLHLTTIRGDWFVINFDDFKMSLNEAGINPPIGLLNKAWATLKAKLNPPLTASAIEECVTVWSETLKRFSATRPILPSEKAALGRAIQAADVESVKLALYGSRFEKGTETFNPAQHLSVHRVLDPKNFARFMSIGAQERSKREKPAVPLSPEAIDPNQPKVFQSTQEALDKTEMTPGARAILESMKKREFIGG